jgi:hypothetical protein
MISGSSDMAIPGLAPNELIKGLVAAGGQSERRGFERIVRHYFMYPMTAVLGVRQADGLLDTAWSR